MDWLWDLFQEHVIKELDRVGIEAPGNDDYQNTFLKLLSEATITILVQEPWQNTVRFKGLKRAELRNMFSLINDPEKYLLEEFGGGKFKLNFHRGLNFIATKNFKPSGEPKWKNLPEIDF